MILGLRTAIYPVKDLAQAKSWYAEVFGVQPYFDEEFYVGFTVGGFELGLMPDGKASPDGALVYWGTSDIAVELDRLQLMGAQIHQPVTEVGGGIKVAAVQDPFGNVVGLIENPVFDIKLVR